MNVASVERLSFTFAGRQEPTLADISFELTAGSLIVLAGPTGSGKSTLLRALAGLIQRHSSGRMEGRVTIAGVDTRVADDEDLARRVGLVLQSADEQICAASVLGELAFGLENLSLPPAEIHDRISAALRRFGLEGREQDSPRQLSGGQQQRLLLAALWAMRPSLLLLDEPLSQLDSVSARELIDELTRLRGSGMTLVVAEHRLDDLLPAADRLLTMADGRLVRDAAPESASWGGRPPRSPVR
jgi:energy-coupling factor transporter ATP-binding protein EcfA2